MGSLYSAWSNHTAPPKQLEEVGSLGTAVTAFFSFPIKPLKNVGMVMMGLNSVFLDFSPKGLMIEKHVPRTS